MMYYEPSNVYHPWYTGISYIDNLSAVDRMNCTQLAVIMRATQEIRVCAPRT